MFIIVVAALLTAPEPDYAAYIRRCEQNFAKSFAEAAVRKIAIERALKKAKRGITSDEIPFKDPASAVAAIKTAQLELAECQATIDAAQGKKGKPALAPLPVPTHIGDLGMIPKPVKIVRMEDKKAAFEYGDRWYQFEGDTAEMIQGELYTFGRRDVMVATKETIIELDDDLDPVRVVHIQVADLLALQGASIERASELQAEADVKKAAAKAKPIAAGKAP